MKKIGIVVNPAKDPDLACLKQVTDQLDKIGYSYAVSCYRFEATDNYSFSTPEECFEGADLVLTLGGDGTILKAAPYAVRYNVPLLGVNLGHLGFLADMEKSEINSLEKYLNDGMDCIERMMLTIRVYRNGDCISEMIALNDAVLRSRLGKPADIVISDGNSDLLDYFCDGLIVASPTGSTAYSMSAGGPILEPASSNIVVTPICPHTLGSRAVVFGTEHTISVRVTNANLIDAHLVYDGFDWGALHDGDIVTVDRYEKPLQLVQLHQKSFYIVLNEKIIRRRS